MKVSVITVCWNSAPVLGRAIASLRAQSWPDIQWILVDGASTDGSVAIARAAARDGDVIVSEPDRGIYNAMNKGVALATGELVYFLNSDDRLFDANVVADIVAIARTVASEIIIGDNVYEGEGVRGRKSHAHIRRWNLLEERICHQASFTRRSLFDRCGSFDERYRVCADHEFFVRALGQGAALRYTRRTIAIRQTGGLSERESALDLAEARQITLQYRRRIDVPVALAYRAVRKTYRALTGRWLDYHHD